MTISELIDAAVAAAQQSTRLTTQVGCAWSDGKDVVHTGFNEGDNHAESAVRGHFLGDRPFVCTWAACWICADAIIGAGAGEVWTSEVCHLLTPKRWQTSVHDGLFLIRRAGIPVYFYSPAGRGPIRFDSKEVYL